MSEHKVYWNLYSIFNHKMRACLVILFLQYFQKQPKFYLPVQHYFSPPNVIKSRVARLGGKPPNLATLNRANLKLLFAAVTGYFQETVNHRGLRQSSRRISEGITWRNFLHKSLSCSSMWLHCLPAIWSSYKRTETEQKRQKTEVIHTCRSVFSARSLPKAKKTLQDILVPAITINDSC